MLKRRDKQHLMVDRCVLEKICGYAGIKESEIVLEIGAGTGNLTGCLVDKSKFVYAIEKDNVFCGTLKKRFMNHRNIKVLNADALKIDLPGFDKVVSNLPYDISRRITERLLGERFLLGVRKPAPSPGVARWSGSSNGSRTRDRARQFWRRARSSSSRAKTGRRFGRHGGNAGASDFPRLKNRDSALKMLAEAPPIAGNTVLHQSFAMTRRKSTLKAKGDGLRQKHSGL